MECTKSQEELCVNEFKIKTVPTIRIYLEDISKNFIDYRNKITLQLLEKEVMPILENNLIKVGSRNIDIVKERALKENKQIFIIYPSKRVSSPLLKSLSTLFKERMLICEEDLDDELKGPLRAAKVPSIVFIKNLYTLEIEEYSGEIERTKLSMWLQERGNRVLAKPDKVVKEIDRGIGEECGKQDSNFCVIGYYKYSQEKDEILFEFKKILDKHKDDPINFYIVDMNSLRDECKTDPSVRYRIYRSKRNKYSDIQQDEVLDDKIDNVLGGSMLSNTIQVPIQQCFK